MCYFHLFFENVDTNRMYLDPIYFPWQAEPYLHCAIKKETLKF